MHDDIDQQSPSVDELVQETSAVAGEVTRIDDGLWAVYGTIPVDGESILGEYATFEEARAALEGFPANDGLGGPA
jgi:hypothetical protein